MELFTTLLSRKSHRSYTEDQINEEQLDKILVAGSLAPFGLPSAGLPQLTVIQNKKILKALGRLFGPENDIIYGAPTLILVSSPEMPMAGVEYATAGCVIENMALAATDLGLGSIFLWGVAIGLSNAPELLEKLDLPEGYRPIAALAVGVGTEVVAKCKELKHKLEVKRI